MNEYGTCICGQDLIRRSDHDDEQYECVGCRQLLIKFDVNNRSK